MFDLAPPYMHFLDKVDQGFQLPVDGRHRSCSPLPSLESPANRQEEVSSKYS
jgi:hypothetical protein